MLQLPTTYDPKNGIPKGAYDAIAAELRSAYAKGFSDAREKAAKIASDHPADENGTDVCRAIEWKIRALESDQ